MAKFKKGTVTDNKGNPIDDFGAAMDRQSRERCCGPDCCEGIYRWRDVVNQAKFVSYVKNGALLTVTEAVYKADKAAGFI